MKSLYFILTRRKAAFSNFHTCGNMNGYSTYVSAEENAVRMGKLTTDQEFLIVESLTSVHWVLPSDGYLALDDFETEGKKL